MSSAEEKVSNNAKIVLISLFTLVGAIVAIVAYTYVVTQDFPDTLGGIFIAAVTGSFTMGGTLITNLWGK